MKKQKYLRLHNGGGVSRQELQDLIMWLRDLSLLEGAKERFCSTSVKSLTQKKEE